MVLMAVCNEKYRFTMIDVCTYGREGGAGIFSRSKFGSQLVAGQLPLPRLAEDPNICLCGRPGIPSEVKADATISRYDTLYVTIHMM
jgi:hypothetical protein